MYVSGFVCLTCSQNRLILKLSQLVYILPEKFKWAQIESKAVCQIVVSLCYILACGIDTATGHQKSYSIVVLVVIATTMLLGMTISYLSLNKLGRSKMIVNYVKIYIEEVNQE